MIDSKTVPRVMVGQIGARRHYAVPRALHSIGVLHRLITDACGSVPPWCWLPQSWSGRVPSRSIRSVLARRTGDIPAQMIEGCLVWTVIGAIPKFGNATQRSQAEVWARRNAAFGRAAVRHSWSDATAIYGYNGAALELFRKGKQSGLACVLDQTAAAWRYNTELLRTEMQQWPDWELMPADLDPNGHMIEREEAEWELADLIVCGSQFVVDSIASVGGPVQKCKVIPYPIPELQASSTPASRESTTKIRVLFAGTLQLRKGIQYFRQLASQSDSRKYEFRAVGPSLLTPTAEKQLQKSVEWVGGISRDQMIQQYEWADVFVLPTLSEGSANVCWEAIAAGLPVLTTSAAGVGADAGDSIPGLTVCANEQMLQRLADLTNGERRLRASIPARSIADYGMDLQDAIVQVATKG